MGNRYSATTIAPTTLSFQFVINGKPTAAHTITHVTIHPTQADAEANTNILETIPEASIELNDENIYEYTAAVLSTAQTYYDKTFVIPIENASAIGFINSFVVEEPVYDDVIPESPGTCTITGTVIDSDGEPVLCGRVYAQPLGSPLIIENQALYAFHSMTYTSSTGYFEIELIRNVSFVFTIMEINLIETILVPDQGTCDLWTLIGVTPDPADPQPDPDPAPTPTPDPGDDPWV